MKNSTQNVKFNHLSVKDLIEARDLFHVHLINKKNVVATAIGRYFIRISDLDKYGRYAPQSKKIARTLTNSIITNFSWPCVLVFVEQWQEESDLIKYGGNDIIPKTIYMPDGRVVPICIIEANKHEKISSDVNVNALHFPKNFMGGGFPLSINSQGVNRIASVGCIVTDGHKYFALTNKHVAGQKGEKVFSVFGNDVIGASSGIDLGKIQFSKLYEGWENKNVLVSCDVGLVEIRDIKMWKTEILGVGEMGELFDLNTNNISLDLIAQHDFQNGDKKTIKNKTVGYGAVSGKLEGEIVAMFYRYKSIGGKEYVSDFLIGGKDGKSLDVHHGDSGTVWMIEVEDEKGNLELRPIALHWGQHEFIEENQRGDYNYSMATCLSNICRELDVDIVRGWNIDNDYSWAKTGHFKIAARACDLTSDDHLDKLLTANKENIGYDDGILISGEGLAMAKSDDFIPLADVPDLWWRYKRFKTEGSNHFADMDETNSKVMNGKSLLELCTEDKNIDIEVWKKFYAEMDTIDPKTKLNYSKEEEPSPRLGSLPFRVWQMYILMVEAVKENKIDDFICLGGTLSHYVGDACQPLHVSYLHAGVPGQETKVHSDYEDSLIFKNATALFNGVNAKNKKVKKQDLIEGGKEAAKLIIGLMKSTFETLDPMTIIKCFEKNTGRGKFDKAWEELGDATIDVIANGCYTMAVIWQSAWLEGQNKRGKNIAVSELKARDQDALKVLYSDYHFAQSYIITDPKFKEALS